MLQEELREQKKEMEVSMRSKDRKSRQPWRNSQDAQSDNVSYSNRSDQYR